MFVCSCVLWHPFSRFSVKRMFAVGFASGRLDGSIPAFVESSLPTLGEQVSSEASAEPVEVRSDDSDAQELVQ